MDRSMDLGAWRLAKFHGWISDLSLKALRVRGGGSIHTPSVRLSVRLSVRPRAVR